MFVTYASYPWETDQPDIIIMKIEVEQTWEGYSSPSHSTI